MPTLERKRKGKTIQAARRRVAARKTIGGTPITSRASISSEIRIAPSSATIPVPTLAESMYPKAYGTTSLRSHQAEYTPRVARDLAEGGEPVPWNCEPAGHYLITFNSGWVARSVWVKT